MPGPWRDVAIVGVHNTKQARSLPGESDHTLAIEAVRGALDDAGLELEDVDGISAHAMSLGLAYDLRLGPAWIGSAGQFPFLSLFECIAAISAGLAEVVVFVAASAGNYVDHASTAPWTRPNNEFIAPWGLFTAAEFALVARTHMDRYGTTPEQLARVAATIRNNGHVNPEAVYHDRGPFTTADILNSRMVADPFHLLDCAMTSEGGCAVVLTRADRAADLRQRPAFVLGIGHDAFGPAYEHPPRWDLVGRRQSHINNGSVGSAAARTALKPSGLRASDIDVLELYDVFSFEVIRQLEAFGLSRARRGRSVRRGRQHRSRRMLSREHRWWPPVVQPRRLGRPTPTANHPWSDAGAGSVSHSASRRCERRVVQQRRRGRVAHERGDHRRGAPMTLLTPQLGPVSRSTPSSLSAAFWDGCVRRELLFQRCDVCNEINFEPTEFCRFCVARNLHWERSAGRGVVTSWTIVWRPVTPSYEVPYAPTIVELDEGYHMMTNIVGCDHTVLATGLRVGVSFHGDADGFVLPYFTPEAPG